ncbi:HNH endonuclease [Algiphilus sp.]|uniref:HNH endonuclease n=1 Tax=Algiphilus sp. TaxID=1872431 RepID=UPI0025C465C5|nr:HNH endonuclease [Algiphilus sp.]MCK5769942.1 hypothetical protein [Algiphilus sp.]
MSPHPPGCALCGRDVPLSFHHLIPRRNHRRPWFRRHFSKTDMQRRGVMLCRECHRAVHRFFDEQTLGRRLNTLEALRAEPAIRRHVAWARKLRAGRRAQTPATD